MDWNFVDIHSHIIFGVDDGSPNLESSINLVAMAYEDGIRKMIATPHWGIINPNYERSVAESNLKLLQEAIADRYPDMQLYMGNELFLVPGYADGLRDGKSCTLADSLYVLVEFPMDIEYDEVISLFRKLILSGYYPIFAHAERYRHVYKNIEGLKKIASQGVLIQINSSALAAPYSGSEQSSDKTAARLDLNCNTLDESSMPVENGKEKSHNLFDKLRKNIAPGKFMPGRSSFADEMLRAGLVNFVATDIHSMPGRMSQMRSAAHHMIDLVGEDAAHKILIENPQAIFDSCVY